MSKKITSSRRRVDATRGPLLSAILRLSGPILTGNLALVIYQVVNTLWLGRAGSDAMAAVAMAFPVMIFLWAIGDGIVFGGSAIIARYTGSGDHHQVNRVAGQVFLLTFAYYLFLALVAYPVLPLVIGWMGAPEAVVPDVLAFIRILLVALPLTELFFAYANLLQSVGNSMTPMKMWTVAMTANILLDPILILGLGLGFFSGLGVTGAALATMSCRLIMGLVSVESALRGRHEITLALGDLRPHPDLIGRILRVSVPIAGERLLIGAEQVVLVSIVAGFGSPVLAAFGVGQRILSLAIMPGFAAGSAATAVVGQNLGAGQIDRCRKASWLTTGLVLGILSAAGLIMTLIPGFLISLFNDEPAVVAHGVAMLRVVGATVGFHGAFFVLGGIYRALERTVPYFVWVLISCWFLRIPLAYLLSAQMDSVGIWVAMAAANVLTFIGAAVHLKIRCMPQLGEITPATTGH